MRRYLRQLLCAVSVAAVAGCASPRAPAPRPIAPVAIKPDDPGTLLVLSQIEPVPRLPEPTTRPATRPSIDALSIYAQARNALDQGQRYLAISLLQKAIALDPYSFDLSYDLGKAYLAVSNVDDHAIDAFARAAALQPDRLDVQLQLGRLYLTKGQLTPGIEHLRLARQTADYATDDGQAVVVDFFLARALKEAGFDRAALDEYDALLQHLQNPSLQIRQTPELAYLLGRPETIYVSMGELYEKHNQYEQALQAYELAVHRDPDNFDFQSRVIRCTAALGQRDSALGHAADLVVKEHASATSLQLLRDICRQLNVPNGEVDALARLHKQRPQDRAVLLALVDMLTAPGSPTGSDGAIRAEALLTEAANAGPVDFDIMWRLVQFLRERGETEQAARVLLSANARSPDLASSLPPLWQQLFRPAQKNHLKLASLAAMTVPAEIEPVRQFWISRFAALYHRDALEMASLDKALAARPAFAPAFRGKLNEIWLNPDRALEEKAAASEQLATSATAAGDTALAAELRGLSLLNQKRTSDAADRFTESIHAGNHSADVQMEYAQSLLGGFNSDARFEQQLWKIISDHPGYEPAYRQLFEFYSQSNGNSSRDAAAQAMKVLSVWRTSLPHSVTAQLIEARIDLELHEPAAAQSVLQQLFNQDPNDAEVLGSLRQMYTQQGHIGEFIRYLEDYRSKHLQDTEVAGELVSVYAEQKRMAEATRVMDETRQAAGSDADLLYAVAQLYLRIDQKQTAEDVLQQVVRIDPGQAGASNDLGYFWADEGRNLAAAEGLIRVAVAAEPDNQSFLDSLGWVLYKRGKFDEAGKFLRQAVDFSPSPDPVVLDHLADTLYRLARKDDAQHFWQKSLKALGDGDTARGDLAALRLELLQKLKQIEIHKPVDVAPVVDSPPGSVRARE